MIDSEGLVMSDDSTEDRSYDHDLDETIEESFPAGIGLKRGIITL